MSLWIIRIVFVLACSLGGYAVSQVRPELLSNGILGAVVGFGFGGLMVGIDEMLKGFSLRAFSAATFGLLLGSIVAWAFDNSGLFVYVDADTTRWLVRLCLFLAFGYIGAIVAMRSNKEDFSLIIPFVRFKARDQAEELLLLDTSAIIDGRVGDLVEANFLKGIIVVPRFVLLELQNIADSSDAIRRAKGRRGLDVLARLQRNPRNEVKILDSEVPEETTVDSKLIRLAQVLGARLFTTDYNLGRIAELQHVTCVNVAQLGTAMKPVILAGDVVRLRVVREGKDKGQGIGYLTDGTMVVVNQGHSVIGQEVDVQIQALHQTGAGMMVFADLAKAG